MKNNMGLALTNETIEKYLGFLSRPDNESKKKLISKLTESMKEKKKIEGSTQRLVRCLGRFM